MTKTRKAPDTATPLIDFDQWADLARRDPAAFEKQRTRTIESMLRRVPVHRQARLRRVQWKVDQIRGRCATPMSACVKLTALMWDSVLGTGGLKDRLEALYSTTGRRLPRAEVVELKGPPRAR